MIRRAWLALALLALMAPAARAQTLDEILAKHWAAEGGLDKIKAVQSWRYTGKMLLGPGMEAPFVMEKKRPNLMRMEFTVQGMTGVQAYDGKQGWMTMPFMGKKDPEAMPPDAQDQVAQQAEFDEPYLDSKARGIQVELIGKEDLEGSPAWKIKITRKNGDVDFSYLDAETFLTLKQEGKRTVRGSEMDGESVMGDYKAEGGLMVPHSIESGAKGMPQRQRMTIEKVEMNPTFDESHFTMPAVAASDTSKAVGDSTTVPKAAGAQPAAPKGAAPKDSKKGAPKTPKGDAGTDTKKSG